jgi:hypothetical protein
MIDKELLNKLIHAVDNCCTYRTNFMMEELWRVRQEVMNELQKEEQEIIPFKSTIRGIFS